MQRWLKAFGVAVAALAVVVGLAATPASAGGTNDSSLPTEVDGVAMTTSCSAHRTVIVTATVTLGSAEDYPETPALRILGLHLSIRTSPTTVLLESTPTSIGFGQSASVSVDLGVSSTEGGEAHLDVEGTAWDGYMRFDLGYPAKDCSSFSFFTATSTCDPAYGVDLHFNLAPIDVNGDPEIGRFTVTTATGVVKVVEIQGGDSGSVDLGSDPALEGTTATIQAVSTIYDDIWSEAGTGSVALSCPQVSDSEALVRALYQAVLEREPDPGGLAYWTAKFDGGTAPSKLAETLARSREGFARVVERHFELALDRGTDPSGLTYWTKKLQATNAPDTLLTNLFGSNEAYRRGDSTSTGYVTWVYSRVLGRNPDSGGLSYWSGKIDRAKDSAAMRRTVARTILFSSEGVRRQVQANHRVVCGVDAPAASLPTYTAKYQASRLNPSTLRAAIVIAGCPG